MLDLKALLYCETGQVLVDIIELLLDYMISFLLIIRDNF